MSVRTLDQAVGTLPLEDFRAALRAFLTDHHPGAEPSDPDRRLAMQRLWAATLHDHGWAAPGWPRPWGGMDLPLEHLVAYYEEMATARAPAHPSPNAFIVGPTILAFGTDAQRQRFLRPIVRGEELWCQGFSEPGAGSDLPALRTRAVRSGGSYRVNGQKVWTSRAMTADWMFALVRTGDDRAGRDGLTYLLIDMQSPGLTVRPLRDMTGGAWFGEVFLDDVEVPVDQRVGGEGEGWRLARHSLGHERSTSRAGMVVRYQRIVAELIELARSGGVTGDPLMRQRLAEISISTQLLRMTFERVMGAMRSGQDPGPASSVSRLFLGTFEQQLHELAVDILGPSGMLAADEPLLGDAGRWMWGFLNTRASTIGAGTAEIQRSTIAERVLGLPRSP
jgi:alkylation response protein AidB-like acyl-CoA dehydrogenase